LHLLPYFGAISVNERVVVDDAWVFAAGVTSGIDGALRLAAELRGEETARAIQLHMVYAPEPPFDSGTPETAPAAIVWIVSAGWRESRAHWHIHHPAQA
jgi:cyclohexyl-isocyanide hydratase